MSSIMKFLPYNILTFFSTRLQPRELWMPDHARWNRARRGFTLVELLVSISIVAILVALLFPVMDRVRDNARRSSCASNQRQIALALRQYAQDFDNVFVSIGDPFLVPGGWSERIATYVKSPRVLQCPGESTLQGNIALDYTDYYYNRNLGPENGPVHEAAIEFAANTILLGEGASRESNYNCQGLGDEECFFSLFRETIPTSATKRHQGGGNYAFVDGHVKWLQPPAIESSKNATANRNGFRF